MSMNVLGACLLVETMPFVKISLDRISAHVKKAGKETVLYVQISMNASDVLSAVTQELFARTPMGVSFVLVLTAT